MNRLYLLLFLLLGSAAPSLMMWQTSKPEKVFSANQGLLSASEISSTAFSGQLGKKIVEVRVETLGQKPGSEPVFKQYRIWTDPSTGLFWSSKDNGTDVNWNQANDYCKNLILGVHLSWRLPSIAELQAIYDKAKNVDGYHIKGGIHLSGAPWSNSSDKSASQAWSFYFGYGMRISLPRSFSLDRRALCVCEG